MIRRSSSQSVVVMVVALALTVACTSTSSSTTPPSSTTNTSPPSSTLSPSSTDSVSISPSGTATATSPSAAVGAPITVWHGYTDVEATEMTTLVTEWNNVHPTAKVDLVFDGGNDTALQKSTAALASGKYPDVVYEFGSSATSLVKKKQLVDLSDVAKDPAWAWDDFYASERQAATVDGKVVGLPALVDNLSLVYNKKLFDAAGVAYPTASWTWQDFRAAAKKLTSAETKNYGWAFLNAADEDTVWRYLAMLWQGGGDLLDPGGKASAVDSPPALAAMQLLHDMAVEDKSVYLDSGNGNYLNLFNSGKIAMLWTGPWDVSSINDSIAYGVEVLPSPDGGTHSTISGPDSWMVLDNGAPRVATAKAFLQWLLSTEVHLKWILATGDLPVRTSEEKDSRFADYLRKFPANKTFVANMSNVTKVRPNIPAYPEISAALGQAVQAVLLGKSAPQAALSQASDDINGVLAGAQ